MSMKRIKPQLVRDTWNCKYRNNDTEKCEIYNRYCLGSVVCERFERRDRRGQKVYTSERKITD